MSKSEKSPPSKLGGRTVFNREGLDVESRYVVSYNVLRMTEDEEFLAAFEAGTWPFEKWHHREHIKVAYLYLCQHPYDVALGKMRAGIKALNIAHKVPERPDRGYHETMTHGWMRLTYRTLSEFGKSESADSFVNRHTQLLSKDALLGFYTRERILSAEARRGFVEPDLKKLPEPATI